MPYRHFVVYPSADLSRGLECEARWKAAGYEVLIGIERDRTPDERFLAQHHVMPLPYPFPGYYQCINSMVARAFDMGADLVTAIGDDMDPPQWGPRTLPGIPITAQMMASRYFSRFPQGEGVLQPCGDPQGDAMVVKGYEHLGLLHNAGRICGSPVIGRGWAEHGFFDDSIDGAHHAFPHIYRSFYADEELWRVAQAVEKLWLDAETMHFHRHWSFRNGLPKQDWHDRAQANWDADKKVFEERRARGWGDEPARFGVKSGNLIGAKDGDLFGPPITCPSCGKVALLCACGAREFARMCTACQFCHHVHSGRVYPEGSGQDYCGYKSPGGGTCACDGLARWMEA